MDALASRIEPGAPVAEEKSADQQAREKIPKRADLPTQYHPLHNLLLCIPLPGITKVGTIILPDRATIVLNEGHIVEKGPLCSLHVEEGDCVTWDAQSEYRMDVDGVKFVLVKETSVTMRIPKRELLGQQLDPDTATAIQQAVE